jgi:hypothetical protein
MLDALVAKLNVLWQHHKNINKFKELLFEAVQDGKLTGKEMSLLSEKLKEFGLTDRDIVAFRADAYARALLSGKIKSAITQPEEKELQNIQEFLKIPDSEIAGSKKELARLRLLNEIQLGHLPRIQVENVVLQRGEIPHWSEAATLQELKVVNRRYEGASHGMSFRLTKRVSYRIGASKGYLLSDKQILPVSDGVLIITNKRIIFHGDAKSFALRLPQILNIEPYGDGLKLDESSGRTRMVKYHHRGNGEIIGTILSQAINKHESKKVPGTSS